MPASGKFNENVIVILVAAALIWFLLFINVWRKTTFLVALHSIIALPFIVLFIWLIVFVLVPRVLRER